jgi:hypothetical protein
MRCAYSKGDGVEIQVEGSASPQTQAPHGVEPAAHELRVGGWINAAAVLGQAGTFGDDIEASKQGQTIGQFSKCRNFQSPFFQL